MYVFIYPFPLYAKFKYNEIYKRYKLRHTFLNYCQNYQCCSMEFHKLPCDWSITFFKALKLFLLNIFKPIVSIVNLKHIFKTGLLLFPEIWFQMYSHSMIFNKEHQFYVETINLQSRQILVSTKAFLYNFEFWS